MKPSRILVAGLLVLGVSAPALAGDLHASIVRAAQAAQQQEQQRQRRTIKKQYAWTGAALVGTGVTMILLEFVDSGETKPGEAGPPRGSSLTRANIGLGLAVSGAVMLAVGHARASAARVPSVAVGKERVTVLKRVAW